MEASCVTFCSGDMKTNSTTTIVSLVPASDTDVTNSDATSFTSTYPTSSTNSSDFETDSTASSSEDNGGTTFKTSHEPVKAEHTILFILERYTTDTVDGAAVGEVKVENRFVRGKHFSTVASMRSVELPSMEHCFYAVHIRDLSTLSESISGDDGLKCISSSTANEKVLLNESERRESYNEKNETKQIIRLGSLSKENEKMLAKFIKKNSQWITVVSKAPTSFMSLTSKFDDEEEYDSGNDSTSSINTFGSSIKGTFIFHFERFNRFMTTDCFQVSQCISELDLVGVDTFFTFNKSSLDKLFYFLFIKKGINVRVPSRKPDNPSKTSTTKPIKRPFRKTVWCPTNKPYKVGLYQNIQSEKPRNLPRSFNTGPHKRPFNKSIWTPTHKPMKAGYYGTPHQCNCVQCSKSFQCNYVYYPKNYKPKPVLINPKPSFLKIDNNLKPVSSANDEKYSGARFLTLPGNHQLPQPPAKWMEELRKCSKETLDDQFDDYDAVSVYN